LKGKWERLYISWLAAPEDGRTPIEFERDKLPLKSGAELDKMPVRFGGKRLQNRP
jgi:hypothetical protein